MDNDARITCFCIELILYVSCLSVFRSRCSKASWVFDFFLTGSLSTAQVSKKHISSKVVVIVLLLCVILTTIAFLSSAMCYIYRRDKCSLQPPIFSSDKETSCNSVTNLISVTTSSAVETQVTIDPPIYPSTGKSSLTLIVRFLIKVCFLHIFLHFDFYLRLNYGTDFYVLLLQFSNVLAFVQILHS